MRFAIHFSNGSVLIVTAGNSFEASDMGIVVADTGMFGRIDYIQELVYAYISVN